MSEEKRFTHRDALVELIQCIKKVMETNAKKACDCVKALKDSVSLEDEHMLCPLNSAIEHYARQQEVCLQLSVELFLLLKEAEEYLECADNGLEKR